jgi:hypothetical protein
MSLNSQASRIGRTEKTFISREQRYMWVQLQLGTLGIKICNEIGNVQITLEWRFQVTTVAMEKQQCVLCVMLGYTSVNNIKITDVA